MCRFFPISGMFTDSKVQVSEHPMGLETSDLGMFQSEDWSVDLRVALGFV